MQRTEGDVMVIKSLCVQCEEDGLTRLLLTRIPFFRDIILMAFECESCGFRNSEVQSAAFQERGCRYELRATTAEVRGTTLRNRRTRCSTFTRMRPHWLTTLPFVQFYNGSITALLISRVLVACVRLRLVLELVLVPCRI